MHVQDPAVHLLRNAGREGLSLNPQELATGGNSGVQLINMAVLTGAATIVLLGYDARDPRSGERWHWFGDHPRPSPPSVFASYRRSFSLIAAAIRAAGVTVLNASPGTGVTAFDCADLEVALA